MNTAGAAVGLIVAPFDEASAFEIVEEPHQRRAFDRHRRRELLLAHAVAQRADIHQRTPGGLGQADQAQLGVHGLSQPPRDAGDEEAEVGVLGGRHD